MAKQERHIDIWNETIKIRDKHAGKTSEESQHIHRLATSHLNSLNTAGGPSMIRDEVETFILQYENK